jgi:hypothetical protein
LNADHESDLFDEKEPYNKKVNSYSSFREEVERYKEILLGNIKFIKTENHQRKTTEQQDIARANQATSLALKKKRASATLKYKATLDPTPIIKYTAFLRDPVHGGTNFDWKGFLFAVLPYWRSKVAPFVMEERSLTNPYLRELYSGRPSTSSE